jgi:hypothetical protein
MIHKRLINACKSDTDFLLINIIIINLLVFDFLIIFDYISFGDSILK